MEGSWLDRFFPTRHSMAYWFVAGFVIAMFLPRLLPEGMFVDGMIYAILSKNLAEGLGSFWQPYLSETHWLPYNESNYFYEHPPLLFGIQALFFKVLGDHYFVEKVFCLFTLGISIWLIAAIWREVYQEQEWEKGAFWLPVWLWYCCPVVLWAYPNNMLDSNMAIFCLLSVWAYLKYIHQDRKWYWLIVSGLSIVAAFCVKGPTGLFPLILPAIAFVALPQVKLKQALQDQFFLLGICFLGALGLYLYAPANAFFNQYLNQQVMEAIGGNRELGGGSQGRLYILRMLFQEIAPMLVISAGMMFWAYKKYQHRSLELPSYSLFFLLIALSASLPLLLSLKQRNFYLLPSLPFFALSLAVLGIGAWKVLIEGKVFSAKTSKVLRGIAVAFVTVALIFSLTTINSIGRPSGEKRLIQDLALVETYFSPKSKMAVCPDMICVWAIHRYMQRYYDIEVQEETDGVDLYLLDYRTCFPEEDILMLQEKGFMPINNKATQQYQLWVRI